MTILIDPGHGGKFPGACANGRRECDVTLSVARHLLYLLRANKFDAYLTREADTNLGHTVAEDLAKRCAIANSCSPTLLVSIHCNAALADTARGFEVWTSVGQTLADHAAEKIVTAFHDAFPSRLIRRDLADGDQDKESQFKILRGTIAPAVLVEIGFLTNAEESAWIAANEVAIAKALASGIDGYRRWMQS